MYCKNCGTENKEEAVFCKECGRKLGVDKKIAPLLRQPFLLPQKALYAIAVASVIIIAVIAINRNPKVNLNKFVEVKFEGYNGYGQAHANVKWDEIEDKYGSKPWYTRKMFSEYGESLADYTLTGVMKKYVTVGLDKSTELGNDDEVRYVWDINEEELKAYLKCKIKFKDQTMRVSDLEEIGTFDPFEHISVTYSGIGPTGTASVVYDGDILSIRNFSCGETSGLSNGDTLTVSLNTEDMDYFAKEYGMVPSATEKEYTVTGLGRYAASISDINAEAIQAMKGQAEDVISEYTAGWTSNSGVDSVNYAGSYLQTANDASGYEHNIYGLIYEIDSHVQASEESDAVNVVQYYDVQFKNIIAYEDNRCEVDLTDYSKPNSSFSQKAFYGEDLYNYNVYYYTGYETLAELKKARVDSLADKFSVEWDMEGGEMMDISAEAETERLCPYSTEREITEGEIQEYLNRDNSSYNFPGDRTMIQMIINEMYALKGYAFLDEELQNYFNQKEWYLNLENKTDDMDEIYQNMSQIEQANITLLEQYNQ